MKHPLHASSYRPPFDSPVHRLDARMRLLGAIALVVAIVSTPPSAWPAFVGYAVLLIAALAVARVPAGYVLARWLVVLPFITAAAAVPFLGGPGETYSLGGVRLTRSGLVVLWNVTVKASLAVTTMALLSGSMHVSDLLQALRRLRVPGTLVSIVALTHRYLHVLLGEAARMRRARDLRHFQGRWIWQAAVVGRMVGTLFLRSVERGERVHAAMLARGFDGTMPGGHPARLRAADVLAAGAWVGAAAALRCLAA